jgi:hypothetical protein
MPESRTYRYGPSRPIAGAFAVGAIASVIEAIVADGATGRLLLGCTAFVLAALAISDLVFAPRLTASETGIAIFAPSTRARLGWAEVDLLRVDERSHLGLASRSLEIEAGDRLIVLSRRVLGRDPSEVCAELTELRSGLAGRADPLGS